MEALSGTLSRQKQRSRRVWIISAVVAIVVLLAVVVPLAVVLPRRHQSQGQPSRVLLPLYLYPDPGAWDPLYAAVNATTQLNFTVIINPESGPGSSSSPGNDYVTAIQTLNAMPNVQTLGYVRTGFANRSISAVLKDVATISNWAKVATNLSMDGIFFDEAPSVYSPDTLQYMTTINDAAKSATGIRLDRMIVHNPGTIPDAGLILNTTDVTVAFEDSYDTYQSKQYALATLPLDRTHYSSVMHGVPGSADLQQLVNQMSGHAAYLFATSLTTNYYESFGPDWKQFVTVVPT